MGSDVTRRVFPIGLLTICNEACLFGILHRNSYILAPLYLYPSHITPSSLDPVRLYRKHEEQKQKQEQEQDNFTLYYSTVA